MGINDEMISMLKQGKFDDRMGMKPFQGSNEEAKSRKGLPWTPPTEKWTGPTIDEMKGWENILEPEAIPHDTKSPNLQDVDFSKRAMEFARQAGNIAGTPSYNNYQDIWKAPKGGSYNVVINPNNMDTEGAMYKSLSAHVNRSDSKPPTKQRVAIIKIDPKGALIDHTGKTWHFDPSALNLGAIKSGQTNILDVESIFNVIYKASIPGEPKANFLQTEVGDIKGER